jgi:hypothetical protein
MFDDGMPATSRAEDAVSAVIVHTLADCGGPAADLSPGHPSEESDDTEAQNRYRVPDEVQDPGFSFHRWVSTVGPD